MHVCKLIKQYQPNVLFIMETHVPFDKTKVFQNGLGYTPNVVPEVKGFFQEVFGPLSVETKDFMYTIKVISSYSIFVRIEKGEKKWLSTGVYGSPIPIRRTKYSLVDVR